MNKMILPIILAACLALLWFPAVAAKNGAAVPEGAGSASLEEVTGSLSDSAVNNRLQKNDRSTAADAASPQMKKCRFVDPDSREYVALLIGYGGFFPVADYDALYRPANLVSVTAGVYYINFLGLSPELHFRHTAMKSKNDPLWYSSRISLAQIFPAIVYRYRVPLPRNSITVYGRVWDGITVLDFTSKEPYLPIIKRKIRETINTFGLSAGCYYDVWRGLLVGLDVSYSVIFTAGKPLQSVSFTVNAGWRIL